MPDPKKPEKPEQTIEEQLAELEAKRVVEAQTLKDDNALLRERLARVEGRQDTPAAQVDPNIFAFNKQPETLHEWNMEYRLAQGQEGAAAANAAEDPQAYAAAQARRVALERAYQPWQEKLNKEAETQKETEHAFEAKMVELGVAKDSDQYRVAKASVKGGVPVEDVVEHYLQPAKEKADQAAEDAAKAENAKADPAVGDQLAGGAPAKPEAGELKDRPPKQLYKTADSSFAALFPPKK